MTREEKDDLFYMANMFVNMTLNGERAKICGRKLDFPVVAQIDGKMEAEYSWEAVKRIVAGGGDFEM